MNYVLFHTSPAPTWRQLEKTCESRVSYCDFLKLQSHLLNLKPHLWSKVPWWSGRRGSLTCNCCLLILRWIYLLPVAVLGPPDVSVSGCGNCLLLRLSVPTTRRLQLLRDLHKELVFHVQRTRDGAQVRARPVDTSVFIMLPLGIILALKGFRSLINRK